MVPPQRRTRGGRRLPAQQPSPHRERLPPALSAHRGLSAPLLFRGVSPMTPSLLQDRGPWGQRRPGAPPLGPLYSWPTRLGSRRQRAQDLRGCRGLGVALPLTQVSREGPGLPGGGWAGRAGPAPQQVTARTVPTSSSHPSPASPSTRSHSHTLTPSHPAPALQSRKRPPGHRGTQSPGGSLLGRLSQGPVHRRRAGQWVQGSPGSTQAGRRRPPAKQRRRQSVGSTEKGAWGRQGPGWDQQGG